MRLLFVMLILLAATPQVSAATLRVCGQCDFTAISDAIAASTNGDTILIESGIYRENLVIQKSLRILGNGAVIEPEFRHLPVISVFGIDSFSLEGVEIKNGSVGMEIRFVNNLSIKKSSFFNNFDGIKAFSIGHGRLDGLSFSGFFTGVSLEDSSLEIENSSFEGGAIAVAAESSRGVKLRNLEINTSNGIELSGGEENLIENCRFDGDTFIHAMSESRLIVGKNDVRGVYAVDDASLSNTYVFDGVNVSGENFQISVVNLKMPDGFVRYGSILNVTINPSIYDGKGSVYFELNLEQPEDFEKTLAIYRFDGAQLKLASDYYNGSEFIPLSYSSNESGVYVLAASKGAPIPHPYLPEKPTPGFEALATIIAIAVTFVLRRRV
jgi:hypothetical protein